VGIFGVDDVLCKVRKCYDSKLNKGGLWLLVKVCTYWYVKPPNWPTYEFL